MRALLARQIDAKARPRPSSAENRPAIDPSEPILAVSPNFDRATDRRQPNHSTPNSDPQVRQTASSEFTQIDPATGAVIGIILGIDLPGFEEGLTFDGTYLYSVSYTGPGDPTIWKIDPITGTLQADSFALPAGTYNGLAFDGDSLWTVNFLTQTLIKVSDPAPFDVGASFNKQLVLVD